MDWRIDIIFDQKIPKQIGRQIRGVLGSGHLGVLLVHNGVGFLLLCVSEERKLKCFPSYLEFVIRIVSRSGKYSVVEKGDTIAERNRIDLET
jgi:hypothetical protein